MRRLLITILLAVFIAIPVEASGFTPPEAPQNVQKLMPDKTDDFGEGLLYILTEAMKEFHPSFIDAIKTCISIIAVSLLAGMLSGLSENTAPVVAITGTVTIGVILFQPVSVFIRLGTQTLQQISQYGKLLLPVLTGSLAAQGAVSKSGAIYTATVFFDTLLSSVISNVLIPIMYIYLCLSVVSRVFTQPLLEQIKNFLRWLMTWTLKTILYVFTGYISITGVVGGTTDAAMLKATKLTISGVVPVVGNIISDASEAVLVSAGIMKNAAGIYGLLAILAIWIGPFLKTGVQYLLLKVSSGICEMFAVKSISNLIKDFSTAMGLVLAMTGTECMLLLISTICFIKGVA